MGRRPKDSTVETLDATLRGEIHAAIDSHAGESAAAIYRRFGLAQRGINERTFRLYVAERRGAAGGDGETANVAGNAASEAPSWDELDRRARSVALELLQSGNAKLYELMLLSKGKRETDKLELERRAEERAQDLYERKIAELEKQKSAADSKLDRMAVEKGIPGDVAERIKDLYGIVV